MSKTLVLHFWVCFFLGRSNFMLCGEAGVTGSLSLLSSSVTALY